MQDVYLRLPHAAHGISFGSSYRENIWDHAGSQTLKFELSHTQLSLYIYIYLSLSLSLSVSRSKKNSNLVMSYVTTSHILPPLSLSLLSSLSLSLSLLSLSLSLLKKK